MATRHESHTIQMGAWMLHHTYVPCLTQFHGSPESLEEKLLADVTECQGDECLAHLQNKSQESINTGKHQPLRQVESTHV